MTGYLVFAIAFLVLAAYCLVRAIMIRRKAVPGSEDYDQERQLAKAYFQRAAFFTFVGIFIFFTKIIWRYYL